MALPSTLADPAIQAKRKQLAQIRYPISVKAIQWAEAHGYSGLIREVDRFMVAYRAAMDAERKAAVDGRSTSYYDRQTPERLSEMLQRRQAEADKIAAALKARTNGNGLAGYP